MAKGPMEIEVKFFIQNLSRIHQRLGALGAKPGTQVLENDTCFDTPQHTIVASGGLLRLRRSNHYNDCDDSISCSLTVKRKPAVSDPDVKVFRELEVQVSDGEVMTAILADLGYYPARVYEKKRQTYVLENTLLCIDTLPFGHFLEIEGPKEAIREAARQLGLKWSKRILTNYLAIFDLLKQQLQLACNDPTFEAFEGLDVSVEPFIGHFEVGP